MSITMNIQSKAATHVGMVRELNEDSYIDKHDEGMWAVADGMGGHEAGEVASQAVVATLEGLHAGASFDETLVSVQSLLTRANSQLVLQSESYPRDRTPGTTVATLLIQGNQGAVVWAGDSRIYRKRNGTFQQLTRDHSHVQDLVDNDLIRPEEAEHHPMANVITRAVGIQDPMDFDTEIFDVYDGDQFLLCSDGLSRLVENNEIADMLDNPDSDEIVQSLLHTALVRGAPDNVTLIYVACGDPQDNSTVVMSIDDLM